MNRRMRCSACGLAQDAFSPDQARAKSSVRVCRECEARGTVPATAGSPPPAATADKQTALFRDPMAALSSSPQRPTSMPLRATATVVAPAVSAGPAGFPSFAGTVIKRPPVVQPFDEYSVNAYQYASSSWPENCDPAAIIYVANDNDIKLAIQYAKKAKIAIAVRSGGHQYLGYSSTTGGNIQVDMGSYTAFQVDNQNSFVTLGPGWRLFDVYKKMAQLKNPATGLTGAFFPHGECSHVALGGHMHTGGYSVFSRSFGLLIDWLQHFDIITADCRKRTIRRPDPSKPNVDNDDMWFSVLGGSPGNFGIVTSATIKFMWASQFPDSRAYLRVFPYIPGSQKSFDMLKATVELVEEFNDDDDLDADANYNVIAVGAQHSHFWPTMDSYMRDHFEDIYGPNANPSRPLPTIIISAAWTNLSGKKDFDTNEAAQNFFHTIEDKLSPFAKIFGINVIPMMVDPWKAPTSIPDIVGAFTWKNVREFAQPCMKRVWAGMTQDITQRGFAEWAASRAADIESTTGLKMASQWASLGGRKSNMGIYAKENPTALGWRQMALNCTMDAFYETHRLSLSGDPESATPWPQPKKRAQAFILQMESEATGPEGTVGDFDRRFLFAPVDSPCLDHERAHYYDSEAVYQRVLATKRRVDPDDVFTPNIFCVGATRKYGMPPDPPHVHSDANPCRMCDRPMIKAMQLSAHKEDWLD